eukprot:jgi/Psemu1/287415/fgenesh1_pg.190_\
MASTATATATATTRSIASRVLAAASHPLRPGWVSESAPTRLFSRRQSSANATAIAGSRCLVSASASATATASASVARRGRRVASTIQPMRCGFYPRQQQLHNNTNDGSSSGGSSSSILRQEERIPKHARSLPGCLSWSEPLQPELLPMVSMSTPISNSSGSGSNGQNGKPKTEPPPTDPDPVKRSPSSTTNNNNNNNHPESHNNKIQEFMDSTVSTVRTNVGSAEATIKKAVEELSTGDRLSVYGIVFLIATIAAAPSVIRRLQSSDTSDSSSYYDIEDPVMDLARMIRGEILENMHRFENGDDNHNDNDNRNEAESESTDEDGENSGSSTTSKSKTNTSGRLGLDRMAADVLNSPQIQEAATMLVTKIIQSSQFKTACSILLKELLKDLLDDPDTLRQVVQLLQNAIADQKIKEAAVQLAMDIFGDDRVLDELVTLVQRLGMEQQVRHATQALLVESAHNALNDPEILDHSMEFATDVVGDDVVQQTAGEALYNTMSYAFRPALSVFLALTGVGLIFVSIAAFRNVNQNPSDAADRAFLSTIEKYTTRLLKILFLPLDFLVACKDALVSIVLFPFRFVSSSVARANKLGKSLFGALTHWVLWLLNLPLDVLSSFFRGSKHVFNTACTNLVDRLRRLVDSTNDSFHGVVLREIAKVTSVVLEKAKVQWTTLNHTLSHGALSVERFLAQMHRTAHSILEGAFAKLSTVTNGALAMYTIPLQKLDDLVAKLIVVRNDALAMCTIPLEKLDCLVAKLTTLHHDALALCTIPLRKLESLVAKLTTLRYGGLATHTISLQKHGKEYFDGLSRGYESLNHYLAVVALRLEELLRKVTGRV